MLLMASYVQTIKDDYVVRKKKEHKTHTRGGDAENRILFTATSSSSADLARHILSKALVKILGR